jgi:hypothetical protein
MTTDFSETYKAKSNDALLRLVREKDTLQDAARRALDLEIEKRGLGGEAFAHFERQELKVAKRAEEVAVVQSESNGRWMLNMVNCFLIFGTAAILTVALAGYIFKPPSEAIRLLTKMSVKVALGLAFIASAVSSRWLTLKRIVLSSLILAAALFGFFAWLNNTNHGH